MNQTPLLSINDLKPLIGMEVEDDTWDATLKQALLLAETKAETFLQSPLRVAEDLKDTFDIKLSNYYNRMGKDGHYTLVSKNRFVRDGFKITVKGIRDDIDVTDSCLYDAEKGVFKVPVTDVERYITLEYSSGFANSGDIPNWVGTLILRLATDIYALPDEDKRNAARGSLTEMPDVYATHNRQVPFAIRPIL